MLAATPFGKEEKRKANPQTSRSATEERKRLSILSRGKGQTNRSQACNAGILAVAKGARWAKKEDSDRRVLLPKQKLRILRNSRRGDPCIGGVWNAWGERGDPGFQMPGMWKEVYCEKEHDPVPAKKSFGVDREDLVVISIGGGCVCAGRSI
jgi:hypothetical protein